ncbi:MAG: hypothetical protein OHK0050_41160 [Roseiflexaceae bacterium]
MRQAAPSFRHSERSEESLQIYERFLSRWRSRGMAGAVAGARAE